MNSIAGDVSEPDFRSLLDAYIQWNKKEAALVGKANRRLWRVCEDKASALAKTILRIATKRDLKSMRDSVQEIALTPSAQYYALALVRLGGASDVVGIIKRVERVSYDVRYWYQVEMGLVVEKRMKELGGPVPIELTKICRKRGFWEDTRGRRSRVASKDKLPLQYSYNRALYLRLVAHAIIGAARRDNLDLLEKLAQHDYRMIARAAASRLAELAGDEGIKMLQAAVTSAIERQNAEAFGPAVRDAEIQRLGLAEFR